MGDLPPGEVIDTIWAYILTRYYEVLHISITCERRASGFLLSFPTFGLNLLLFRRFGAVLPVRRSFAPVVALSPVVVVPVVPIPLQGFPRRFPPSPAPFCPF